MNFTVYIRDTPGRVKDDWGDVSYIWQIEIDNQDGK